jgi:hypothetical protein
MDRIVIQWQDQFGHWQRFQEKQNEADAYRTKAAGCLICWSPE